MNGSLKPSQKRLNESCAARPWLEIFVLFTKVEESSLVQIVWFENQTLIYCNKSYEKNVVIQVVKNPSLLVWTILRGSIEANLPNVLKLKSFLLHCAAEIVNTQKNTFCVEGGKLKLQSAFNGLRLKLHVFCIMLPKKGDWETDLIVRSYMLWDHAEQTHVENVVQKR